MSDVTIDLIENSLSELLDTFRKEKDTLRWRLENPSVGTVLTIRTPRWKFQDGNTGMGDTFGYCNPFSIDEHPTFYNIMNAYEQLKQLESVSEASATPYMRYLATVANKIGSYNALIDFAESKKDGMDRSSQIQAMKHAVQVVESDLEATIAMLGNSDYEIPLEMDGYRQLRDAAAKDYKASFVELAVAQGKGRG